MKFMKWGQISECFLNSSHIRIISLSVETHTTLWSMIPREKTKTKLIWEYAEKIKHLIN